MHFNAEQRITAYGDEDVHVYVCNGSETECHFLGVTQIKNSFSLCETPSCQQHTLGRKIKLLQVWADSQEEDEVDIKSVFFSTNLCVCQGNT